MRSTPDRHQQVGEFFIAYTDRLHRAVERKINARRELIEDACANAWAILLRRPDITLNARGLKWLTTVAINEALMLLRQTRGETPVGTFQADSRGHDDGDEPEPADTDAPGTDERALERIDHAERVHVFRQLKPREREALYLKALGYSYHEICEATGSSYTAVDRRLKEGRAHLHRLDRERAEPDRDEYTQEGGRTRRARGLHRT